MNVAFPYCAGSRMNVMMRTQRVAYFINHAVDQVGGMTSQQHPDTHRYLSFGSKLTNSLRGLSNPAGHRLGAAGRKTKP